MLNIWLSTMAFIYCINTIAWSNNVDVKLLIWCDITTKIHIGFNTGVPAASMCIMRQMESIASTRAASMTEKQHKRRRIVESLICIGLPVIFMALHYIVQGHRMDIYEEIGCLPNSYNSVPSMIIITIPPLVMAIISLFSAGSIIFHFIRHRLTFATCLHSSPFSISVSRYIRLLALSAVVVPWEMGMDIFLLQYNISLGLNPYSSWASVHEDFSRVRHLPWVSYPDKVRHALMVAWWIVPTSCINLFIFFGIGSEAMKDYRRIFNWFKKYIMRQKTAPQPEDENSLCLPVIQPADMPRSPKFGSRLPTSHTSTAKYRNSESQLFIHVALPSSLPAQPPRAFLLGGSSNEHLPHTRAPSANNISRCTEVQITIERTMF